MQMLRALRPFLREGPRTVVSGAVEVERIARAGLGGAAHDESERGRAEVAGDKAEIHAVRGERCGERFAVAVGGNARNESGLRAQPGEADRDVIGRSSQHRIVGVGLDRIGDEVDQRLAGDQNHRFARHSARLPAAIRLRPACRRFLPSCRIPRHSVPARADRGWSLCGRRTARGSRRPLSAG